MAELDLDAIERHARAAEGHTEWVVDVLALVAEVRRLRAELDDWRYNLALRAYCAPDADLDTVLDGLDSRMRDRQTLAAVYGYELGEQESLERLQQPQEIIQQMALQLRAAIALHQPDPDGGMGYQPDGGYGDIDPACSTCGTSGEYAVPWPCQTYESLARAQQLLNDQMPDYDQRVRREAAADALAHAADLIGRHHGDQHGLRISEHVDRWAAEVRAGTRTIPSAGDSSAD